jgi:hypothetical protein
MSEQQSCEAQKFYGKYRGKVVNNMDVEVLGRIMAEVAAVPVSMLNWAMPCVPYAGPQVGFYAIPPIGANVWIEYEGGDPNFPIWSGCFWGELEVPMQAPPEIKIFKTQFITMILNDVPEIGGFTLNCIDPAVTTPLSMTFNSEGITLTCPEAVVTMTPESITLTVPESVISMTADTITTTVPPSTMTLMSQLIAMEAPAVATTAEGDITQEAGGVVSIKAAGDVDISALGAAGLSAAGDVTVKGGGAAQVMGGGDTAIVAGGAVNIAAADVTVTADAAMQITAPADIALTSASIMLTAADVEVNGALTEDGVPIIPFP